MLRDSFRDVGILASERWRLSARPSWYRRKIDPRGVWQFSLCLLYTRRDLRLENFGTCYVNCFPDNFFRMNEWTFRRWIPTTITNAFSSSTEKLWPSQYVDDMKPTSLLPCTDGSWSCWVPQLFPRDSWAHQDGRIYILLSGTHAWEDVLNHQTTEFTVRSGHWQEFLS